MNYIRSVFPEVYQKEVEKKGFGIALHCTDEALLEGILQLGCDVNQEKKPFPPLHNFADLNNIIGIKFLLDHGANLECRNQYKQTALHRAIMRENVAAIEMLLKHGANIQATDQDGKTPMDLAKACENKAIVNMMD
ncbi:ankyrin repeat domain-containing protein [Paenibacillus ginsengarvi]|uniref:ankyrin repeat domain-containing protein n=1 Tax=Paenibacillus ginsengarvi TaxID=400777 RepID=UPI001F00FC3C|nr:ankyrin repeat domain-containing protein [Paenibacillus ginsengarvi]